MERCLIQCLYQCYLNVRNYLPVVWEFTPSNEANILVTAETRYPFCFVSVCKQMKRLNRVMSFAKTCQNVISDGELIKKMIYKFLSSFLKLERLSRLLGRWFKSPSNGSLFFPSKIGVITIKARKLLPSLGKISPEIAFTPYNYCFIVIYNNSNYRYFYHNINNLLVVFERNLRKYLPVDKYYL